MLQGDYNRAFVGSDAYVKILLKKRFDQLVIFSRNVQGYASVLVYAFAAEVPFFCEPKLEADQPENLSKKWSTVVSASDMSNVRKNEVLFCKGLVDQVLNCSV